VVAGYYLAFYTLATSLPLLRGIAYLQFTCGTVDYLELVAFELSAREQVVIWFFFFSAFASKVPR
jgi:NADH:ubiquinone oxidoreductase subunit 4 (subunit M)